MITEMRSNMQGKNVRASFQEEACSGATVVSEKTPIQVKIENLKVKFI